MQILPAEEKTIEKENQIKTEKHDDDLKTQNNQNMIENEGKINDYLNTMTNNNYEEKAQEAVEPILSSKIDEITKKGKEDNFIEHEPDIKKSHLDLLKKIKKSKLSKISKLRHLKKLDLKML